MKKLSSLLLAAAFVIGASAQCDPVTFDGLTSDTMVSDQFQECGMIFSTPGSAELPATYDYGAGSWGMIMHSSTWYSPIRIDFVDGANGTPLSISSISFSNPIDSQIDVIVLEAYDASDNLLGTYTSNSPEEVVFDYGSPDIFYVILDDVNDESAYVIDNMEIVQNVVSVNESSATLAPRYYPNPFEHTLTVDRIEVGDKIELFDVTGRMVYTEQATSSQITISGDRLGAGRYLLQIFRDGVPILTEAVKR